MKSYTNLWPRIISFENLYEAFRAARRGKRGRSDVAAFEFDLEANLLSLQRELLDETYRPGGYRNFVVHEPVARRISAAPFRDRVVHHALCRVVEPLFDRTFLPHSFANRAGKGTHRALDRCRALARRHPYVLTTKDEDTRDRLVGSGRRPVSAIPGRPAHRLRARSLRITSRCPIPFARFAT